ncbi:hypothetical protein ACTD5D_19995 [Nocardia takedensis]|uniref:hypothetical protein n=1 Tax=Nocardia takedensis TaxID=259390 RepID=UPI00030AC13F|nr:hypothetical protein [Nocardia takedensis]
MMTNLLDHYGRVVTFDTVTLKTFFTPPRSPASATPPSSASSDTPERITIRTP